MSSIKWPLLTYGALAVILAILWVVTDSVIVVGLLALVVLVAGFHIIHALSSSRRLDQHAKREAELRKARPTGAEHPHY